MLEIFWRRRFFKVPPKNVVTAGSCKFCMKNSSTIKTPGSPHQQEAGQRNKKVFLGKIKESNLFVQKTKLFPCQQPSCKHRRIGASPCSRSSKLPLLVALWGNPVCRREGCVEIGGESDLPQGAQVEQADTT